MSPLALLKFFSPTTWAIPAIGAAAVLVAHLVDVRRHEVRAREAGRAEVQAKWDAQRVIDQAAALKAQQAERDKEDRWNRAKKESDDESQRAAQRRMANAASLDAAAVQLRAAAAAAIGSDRRAASEGSGLVSGGSATIAAARVCSELLGAAETRLRVIAQVADARRDAGLACEASYDALTDAP